MSKKSEIIVKKILDTIRKCYDAEIVIDDKKFAFEVCAEFFCSERKAKEYIKIARVLFAREISSGRLQF